MRRMIRLGLASTMDLKSKLEIVLPGFATNSQDTAWVGREVGAIVGGEVGDLVGKRVGNLVGLDVGADVGSGVGASVGELEG